MTAPPRGSDEPAPARVDPAEELDELAALAAHELAGPLTKLRAFADLLRQDLGDVPTAADESLCHLVAAAQEAELVVSGFHEWARAGRTRERVAASLGDLVQGAALALAARGLPDGLAVEIPAEARVHGDREALVRLLAHLLRNAWLHGGLSVGGRARVAARPDGAHWRIDVEDDGPGIPRDQRARALAPFTRLGSRRGIPGAGLGLATCARIAAAHEGRLALSDSSLGGLCATLWLPASAV